MSRTRGKHAKPTATSKAVTAAKAAAGTGAVAAVAGATVLTSAPAFASAAVQASPVASGAGATASYANGTWTLDSGHGAGGSAQVDLVNPGTSAAEPTMTVDRQGAGNPRWVIEFHNGTYLFGSPAAGASASKLAWTLEPSGKAEPDYAHALADAQAGGADDQVTAAFIVEDTGNPDTTVNLTNVTYDGEPVVQATPPAAAPVLSHGRAVSVAATRENVIFTSDSDTWVHFVIVGPGAINGHEGWVHAKAGVNQGVYTGLDGNHHGYAVFYTPVKGQGSTEATGNTGHVWFVSDTNVSR